MSCEKKAKMYEVIVWSIAFVWLGYEFIEGVIR